MQLDEWLGTVAAESDITKSSEDLYAVIDLDREVWSILAVDFFDGTSRSGSEVNVYAVNKVENDLLGMSHDKLIALSDESGSIPVTNFKVHGVDAERIIKRVFKRYAVRLRSKSTADRVLHVEKLDDLKLAE